MIPAPRPLHTGRLVLTPENAAAMVPADALADRLRRLGLIAGALPGAGDAFAPGDAFLELIAFTGCAVQLDQASADPDPAGTAPAGHRGQSHVRLPEPTSKPGLITGRNTRPPRCPACGQGLKDWREQLLAWPGAGPASLVCGHCGADAPAWRWRWGRHGGSGRSFVCIEGVFPGEASPLPALLDALAALGAGPWRAFYIQD